MVILELQHFSSNLVKSILLSRLWHGIIFLFSFFSIHCKWVVVYCKSVFVIGAFEISSFVISISWKDFPCRLCRTMLRPWWHVAQGFADTISTFFSELCSSCKIYYHLLLVRYIRKYKLKDLPNLCFIILESIYLW